MASLDTLIVIGAVTIGVMLLLPSLFGTGRQTATDLQRPLDPRARAQTAEDEDFAQRLAAAGDDGSLKDEDYARKVAAISSPPPRPKTTAVNRTKIVVETTESTEESITQQWIPSSTPPEYDADVLPSPIENWLKACIAYMTQAQSTEAQHRFKESRKDAILQQARTRLQAFQKQVLPKTYTSQGLQALENSATEDVWDQTYGLVPVASKELIKYLVESIFADFAADDVWQRFLHERVRGPINEALRQHIPRFRREGEPIDRPEYSLCLFGLDAHQRLAIKARVENKVENVTNGISIHHLLFLVYMQTYRCIPSDLQLWHLIKDNVAQHSNEGQARLRMAPFRFIDAMAKYMRRFRVYSRTGLDLGDSGWRIQCDLNAQPRPQLDITVFLPSQAHAPNTTAQMLGKLGLSKGKDAMSQTQEQVWQNMTNGARGLSQAKEDLIKTAFWSNIASPDSIRTNVRCQILCRPACMTSEIVEYDRGKIAVTRHGDSHQRTYNIAPMECRLSERNSRWLPYANRMFYDIDRDFAPTTLKFVPLRQADWHKVSISPINSTLSESAVHAVLDALTYLPKVHHLDLGGIMPLTRLLGPNNTTADKLYPIEQHEFVSSVVMAYSPARKPPHPASTEALIDRLCRQSKRRKTIFVCFNAGLSASEYVKQHQAFKRGLSHYFSTDMIRLQERHLSDGQVQARSSKRQQVYLSSVRVVWETNFTSSTDNTFLKEHSRSLADIPV